MYILRKNTRLGFGQILEPPLRFAPELNIVHKRQNSYFSAVVRNNVYLWKNSVSEVFLKYFFAKEANKISERTSTLVWHVTELTRYLDLIRPQIERKHTDGHGISFSLNDGLLFRIL